MENVVTVLFEVESEAYQALSEIRQNLVTSTYAVAEAALLKCDGNRVMLLDGVDSGTRTADDTTTGLLIGSIVGILGGPLGVLLGAGTGALVGGVADASDASDDASMFGVLAGKLNDGDVAVIALVQEDSDTAFDAAVSKYACTIIRRDATDVYAEVDRARELEADLARQAKEQMRAERKAERHAKAEERKASMRAYFDGIRASIAGRDK